MAKKTKKKSSNPTKISSVVAKSEDGTVQITFTIPFKKIKKSRDTSVEKLGKNIEVPGFRKGKAPSEKVRQHIPENTLLEETLNKLLPHAFNDAVQEHKLSPAIYPKFELVKATDKEDWQVRATTCEIPEVELGDYKKLIVEETKASKIWTPDKQPEASKSNANLDAATTRQEKEQKVINTLIEKIKIKIPKLLIDKETESRLANLLERIEKLGLTLESYLASVNKTAETLRKEYEMQAHQSLALELTLETIAKKENVKVDKSEVDKAIEAAGTTPDMKNKLNTPQQRKIIEGVLRRRAALDSLVSLL